MRDRLRAVECPMELIDQIGGWKAVGGVGTNYGHGYAPDLIREKFKLLAIQIDLKD